MNPLNSATAQSVVRHVLAILGLLGAIRANNDQIEGWIPSIAIVITLAVNLFWSRKSDTKLAKTDTNALGLMLAGLLLLPLLGGCAAQVGSTFKQTDGLRDITNGSPNTTAVEVPGTESLTTNGTLPSGYIASTSEENRWLYNGGVPVSTSVRRNPDGTLVFNMGSGKDTIIEAGSMVFDPKTGVLTGKNLKLSSNASEPARAANESLDKLTDYWTSRDQAARDVLIKQIETTGQIPKDLAPFVVQLLLGL